MYLWKHNYARIFSMMEHIPILAMGGKISVMAFLVDGSVIMVHSIGHTDLKTSTPKFVSVDKWKI